MIQEETIWFFKTISKNIVIKFSMNTKNQKDFPSYFYKMFLKNSKNILLNPITFLILHFLPSINLWFFPMSYPHHLGYQWCGGPHNGGNCPGCGMVESGYRPVYNQDPYSYHNTTDLFHQPPNHVIPTYLCEYCGGHHQGFECLTRNTFVYE